MLGIWIVSLGVTIAIPTQSYAHYVFNNEVKTDDTWTQFMDGYPSVSYQAVVTAKTDGVFSAANPIDIEVKVSRANITDLTRDYTQVMFADTTRFIQNPSLPLTSSPDGGWVAKGKVTFFEEGKTWMFLAPEPPTGMVLALYPAEWAHITSQTEILSIGPASDTLGLQLNSFAVQMAIIFGSFSILLLTPMIEAIFVRDDDKNKSDTSQNNTGDKDNSSKPKAKK